MVPAVGRVRDQHIKLWIVDSTRPNFVAILQDVVYPRKSQIGKVPLNRTIAEIRVVDATI